MATITIPIRNDIYNYNFNFAFDDIIHSVYVKYLLRQDKWFLSIEGIFTNQIIVGGVDLLKPYKYVDECPQGLLMAVDKDGLYRDNNQSNFSDNISLQYTEV